MERWGLHRRIALLTMSLVGTSPLMLIAGLMGVTAFISMWVSNTATTVVMLPIGMSVVSTALEGARDAGPDHDGSHTRGVRNFATCVVLGIAYAASIGGVGTLIGTPPNTYFAGFFEKTVGQSFSFDRWLWAGLPLLVLFLPAAWAILTLLVFPVRGARISGARRLIREQLASLGPVRPTEWAVLVTFLGAAGAWIFRPQLCRLLGLSRTDAQGAETLLLTDAGIAITAALVLFILPVSLKQRRFVLDWPTASRLPWGVLLLFGGGISLADSMTSTGCNVYLGSLFTGLERLPTWVMILTVCAAVTFVSELASNIAVTAAMLPVMRAVEQRLSLPPGMLLIPTTLAASCGFMLPVATAPNALAFATGHASVRSMLRAGILLDLLGIGLITLVTTTLGTRALAP
jgi:sodium-dependent dicarboxylate transporter 2/3/5